MVGIILSILLFVPMFICLAGFVYLMFQDELERLYDKYNSKRDKFCTNCAYMINPSSKDSPDWFATSLWECGRTAEEHYNGLNGNKFITYSRCAHVRGTRKCKWKGIENEQEG